MSASRALPFLSICMLLAAAGAAAAAGPFGVGLPEPAPSAGGLFPDLFRTIAAWQSAFYKDLTEALRVMRSDGSAGIWLAGVSFLYGVFHALGPGHGKAVVSAYVLANGETARNGAVLAMASAFVQGATAVAIVSVAGIALGATSMAMTRAAEVLEIGSFALITGLGLLLVWRKLLQPMGALAARRLMPVPAGLGPTPVFEATVRSAGGRSGGPPRSSYACDHAPRGPGLDCACGHAHLPPSDLAAGRLDWSKASASILAVGLRPCTGALIVLVFSLSQGLYWAGIAATFAMALGTGITVSLLVLAAVSARGLAVRLAGSGDSPLVTTVYAGIEALAACGVLLFGLLMLGAALSG